MIFSVFNTNRELDIFAWVTFLLSAIICVFAISYVEMQKEPAGLLVLDVTSTQPGVLKVLYTKDGVLTDPGWEVNFPQGKVSQSASFPISAGQYELIGFKPLVEAGGKVSIKNLKIISGSGVNDISTDNFVSINQLDILSSQTGEKVIAPAQDASDPFGVIPNLQKVVPGLPFALQSFLWIAAGKLILITVFLMLMYGLSGSLPFARGLPNKPRPEPGRSQWLGFLAIGLIVLYLRNAHSIFVPVLYAEDGFWSAGIINHGFFYMLFNARPDYFVFGNVLLIALAQLTNAIFFGYNLTYLPHFVSLYSILFYATLAVAPIVLLRGVLCIEARLILWLLVLLIPLGDSSYEMLGRLNNIGYAFLFVTYCLLIWRRHFLQSALRKQIIVVDLALFICANTNPLCYPIIAIALGYDALHNWLVNGRPRVHFWLKEYMKSFSTRSAIVLLIMLFLMGLWILVRELRGVSPLAGEIVLRNVPEMIVARSFLYPIIFPFYTNLNNMASSLLLIIVIVTVFLLAKGLLRERFILISATVVLVACTAITLLSRPGLIGIMGDYITSFPDRYFYGLNLLFYLVFVSALAASFGTDRNSWRRISANTLAGGIIALYVGSTTFMFEYSKPRFVHLPETTFREEVRKAYIEGRLGPDRKGYNVALHPQPLFTDFPANYVIATALGVRFPPSMQMARTSEMPMKLSEAAHNYERKIVYQKAAGRLREDGLFFVSGGSRSWIPNGNWLIQNNMSPADVIEISHEEFSAIPDSGMPVK